MQWHRPTITGHRHGQCVHMGGISLISCIVNPLLKSIFMFSSWDLFDIDFELSRISCWEITTTCAFQRASILTCLINEHILGKCFYQINLCCHALSTSWLGDINPILCQETRQRLNTKKHPCLLWSANPCPNAVHMKPFSTSVFKILIWIIATTTKICTRNCFTQVFTTRCTTISHALLHIDAYELCNNG